MASAQVDAAALGDQSLQPPATLAADPAVLAASTAQADLAARAAAELATLTAKSDPPAAVASHKSAPTIVAEEPKPPPAGTWSASMEPSKTESAQYGACLMHAPTRTGPEFAQCPGKFERSGEHSGGKAAYNFLFGACVGKTHTFKESDCDGAASTLGGHGEYWRQKDRTCCKRVDPKSNPFCKTAPCWVSGKTCSRAAMLLEGGAGVGTRVVQDVKGRSRALLVQGTAFAFKDSAGFEPGSEDFTLEAYIIPEIRAAPTGALVSKGGVQDAFAFSFDPSPAGSLVWSLTVGGVAEVFSGDCAGDGAWAHVALTREGSAYSLWCRGQKVNQWRDARALPMFTGDLKVGAGFKGYVDDLRVTKGIARYTDPDGHTPSFDAPEDFALSRYSTHLAWETRTGPDGSFAVKVQLPPSMNCVAAQLFVVTPRKVTMGKAHQYEVNNQLGVSFPVEVSHQGGSTVYLVDITVLSIEGTLLFRDAMRGQMATGTKGMACPARGKVCAYNLGKGGAEIMCTQSEENSHGKLGYYSVDVPYGANAKVCVEWGGESPHIFEADKSFTGEWAGEGSCAVVDKMSKRLYIDFEDVTTRPLQTKVVGGECELNLVASGAVYTVATDPEWCAWSYSWDQTTDKNAPEMRPCHIVGQKYHPTVCTFPAMEYIVSFAEAKSSPATFVEGISPGGVAAFLLGTGQGTNDANLTGATGVVTLKYNAPVQLSAVAHHAGPCWKSAQLDKLDSENERNTTVTLELVESYGSAGTCPHVLGGVEVTDYLSPEGRCSAGAGGCVKQVLHKTVKVPAFGIKVGQCRI